MANVSNVNWKIIERHYRAGLLSVSEIAREHGIAEGTIRAHAKKNGWKRDLSSEMHQRARTLMVENLAKVKDGKAFAEAVESVADENIIEEAARTQVEVVRQHQQTLGRGHSLTMRMLQELDDATSQLGELEELIRSSVSPIRQQGLLRAVSLSSRATILRDLATSARLWVTLERQAFNIADDKNRDEQTKKIDEMTADELREDIVKEINRMEIVKANLSEGVAKPQSNGKVH